MTLIGILQWTSKLGRIHIIQETGLMPRFNATLHEGPNKKHLWQDAIAKDMGTLKTMEVFDILSKGESVPKDYTFVMVWMIFDVKMNFRRKARLLLCKTRHCI